MTAWMDGPGAYLTHLLGWSLPVLAGQAALLAVLYRGRLRRLARVLLPPVAAVTAWLVAADHLAISSGIWRFGAGKHLGVRVGAVPLEEVLFFLITNLLVAFGLALFARRWLPPREAH